ncbi:MAG: hypothetical protein LBO79_02430 [Zoogloeaceae bacterium]|nr:hypothetical protein [Zoogloeaceae bacterium]
MSPKMEKLKGILSCVEYNGAQDTNIMIRESDSRAVLRKITLTTDGANRDWFAFNPDEGRKVKNGNKLAYQGMSPLLAEDERHGHHCACDCVVIWHHEGKLTVLYIDLKSGNPSGYEKQFRSTRQFVRYALGVLKEFHSEHMSVVDERYIIFHTGKRNSMNKLPTVSKPMGKTAPDSACKRVVVNADTLYLKEFLAS